MKNFMNRYVLPVVTFGALAACGGAQGGKDDLPNDRAAEPLTKRSSFAQPEQCNYGGHILNGANCAPSLETVMVCNSLRGGVGSDIAQAGIITQAPILRGTCLAKLSSGATLASGENAVIKRVKRTMEGTPDMACASTLVQMDTGFAVAVACGKSPQDGCAANNDQVGFQSYDQAKFFTCNSQLPGFESIPQ
jgi:hypothetical protein